VNVVTDSTPAETSEEKRRRLLEENRVRALNAPLRDPGFVLKIAQAEGKLLTAQAELEKLRAGDVKKNRKAIKRAENQVRGLSEKLAEIKGREQFVYDLLGPAREPLIRAVGRGEILQAHEAETAEIKRDDYGAKVVHRSGKNRGIAIFMYSRAVRVKKLTGVQHAFAAGHLGDGPDADRRLAVGQHYGEVFEVVQGMTSSGGEGGGGYGPKGPQPRVIEAGQDYRDFTAGITERQKDALDHICGRSMRLGQAAVAMGADPRTVRRLLVSGLDAAGRSLVAERARRAKPLDEAA